MVGEIVDEDYASLAAFRFELRQFLSFSEKAAREAGLPPQQYQALLAIRAAGDAGMLVGNLAAQLLLKPHSTSELINRLAENELVTRNAMSDDRRQVRVVLSAHACDILASLADNHRAELRRLRPLLLRLLEAL